MICFAVSSMRRTIDHRYDNENFPEEISRTARFGSTTMPMSYPFYTIPRMANTTAPSFGITAKSRVSDLARSTILDVLSGIELVAYLRILAAAAKGSRRVRLLNSELHRNRNGRTATQALRGLEGFGLIKVRDAGTLDRTIEVLV